MTKKCKKCGRELPVEEFSVNKRASDNRLKYCKKCYSKYAKKLRKKQRERELQHYSNYFSHTIHKQ